MAYFLQSYGLNNVQNHRLSNMPSLVIVELTRILFLAWKKYADPFEIIYANCGIAPCLSVFFRAYSTWQYVPKNLYGSNAQNR